MQFSAVLLAGGKSSRMGRDKASLVVDGLPLWRRQLTTLAEAGADEVFISGPPNGPWTDVECVVDDMKDAGPLAGIAAGLRRSVYPWLLVLAVDMPAMTADFLRNLATLAARTTVGAVPILGGRLEPLAAIYPRAALALAEQWLHSGRRKLEEFVLELERLRLVERHPVSERDAALFANWNEPRDVNRTKAK